MFRKFSSLLVMILTAAMGFLHGEGLQNSIDNATTIVREFEEIPEESIPPDVLRRAEGLAIITVYKAGFIFSGRGGFGLVVAKTSDGWSAPSAIGVIGAGFGFQVGAEATDFVMVLNTREAVEAFSEGKNISLGGNLSIAAGPVGRTAEGGVLPVAAVYSYSRSQGAFAGISLEGTLLGEQKKSNARFYGKPVTANELLSGKIPPPKSADALYRELNRYSKE